MARVGSQRHSKNNNNNNKGKRKLLPVPQPFVIETYLGGT